MTQRAHIARLITALSVAVTLVLTLPAGAAGAAPASPAGDQFAASLDEGTPQILSHYRVPGMVISRIEKGSVAWTKAYGVADIRRGTPMSAGTVFDLGVESTVLAAWGIMHLADEGRLDLNAPAEQYLTSWHFPAADWNPELITVRQLLSHTGGVNTNGYTGYNLRRTLPTLTQLLTRRGGGSEPLAVVYAPGSECRYSSGGYAVLQALIQDVTGMPYADFIAQEVLQPLGIGTAACDWTPALRAAAATPYSFGGFALPYYRQTAQAALGLRGTVPDLAKLIAASVAGPDSEPAGRGVVRPETLELAMAGEQGTGGYMGLAYGISTLWNGTKLVTLAGNSLGFETSFVLDPATGNGFALATNSQRAYPAAVWVENEFTRAEYGISLEGGIPSLPAYADGSATISLWLAGLLFLALLIRSVFFWRGLKSGRRRWQARPGLRAMLPAILGAIAALVWIGWFYGPLPQPLPVSAAEVVVPPEFIWPTVSVVLWAALGFVLGFCPAVGERAALPVRP